MLTQFDSFTYVDYIGKNPYRYLALPANASQKDIEDARNNVPGMFDFGEEDWDFDLKGYEVLDRTESTINQMVMELDKDRFIHSMFFACDNTLFGDGWENLRTVSEDLSKDFVDVYDRFIIGIMAYTVTKGDQVMLYQIFSYMKYAFDDNQIRRVAATRGFSQVSQEQIIRYKERMTNLIYAMHAAKGSILCLNEFEDHVISNLEIAKLCMPYLKDYFYELLKEKLDETIEFSKSERPTKSDHFIIMKNFFPQGSSLAYLLKEYCGDPDVKYQNLWNASEAFLVWIGYKNEVSVQAVNILERCLGSIAKYSPLAFHYLQLKDFEKGKEIYKEGVRRGDYKCYSSGVWYMITDGEECEEYLNTMMQREPDQAYYYRGMRSYYKGDYGDAIAFFDNIDVVAKLDSTGCGYVVESLAKVGRNEDAVSLIYRFVKEGKVKRSAEYRSLGEGLITAGELIWGIVLIMHAVRDRVVPNLAFLDSAGFSYEGSQLCPNNARAAYALSIAQNLSLEDFQMSTWELYKKWMTAYKNGEPNSARMLIYNCMRVILYGDYEQYEDISINLENLVFLLGEVDNQEGFHRVYYNDVVKAKKLYDGFLNAADWNEKENFLYQTMEVLTNIDYPTCANKSRMWGLVIGTIYQMKKGTFGQEPIENSHKVIREYGGVMIGRCFENMARAGSNIGHRSLAIMLFGGSGIAQNDEQAKKHLEIAAKMGDKTAMHILSKMYEPEFGYEANMQKAYNILNTAAYLGCKEALEDINDPRWNPYRNQQ